MNNNENKRYLRFTCGPDFLDDITVRDRDDVASFRLVLEPDRGVTVDDEDRESITAIMEMAARILHGMGIRIDGMQVSVCNDPESGVIMSLDNKHRDRYRISLDVENMSCWDQVIYQLGYLLSGCVMAYGYGAGRVPWIEETICETMSLQLLHEFRVRWKKFSLGRRDPGYADHLFSYIHDYMTDQAWTNRPAACRTREELLEMNTNAVNRTDERVGTVVQLFNLTGRNDLPGLLQYRLYALGDTGLMDTAFWLECYPESLAVRYLCSLQDNAAGRQPNEMMMTRIYEKLD